MTALELHCNMHEILLTPESFYKYKFPTLYKSKQLKVSFP